MIVNILSRPLEGHPGRLELVATVEGKTKGEIITKHRNIDTGSAQHIEGEIERYREDILSGKV